MKNSTIITITNIHGNKQYTISQLLKKFFIIFAIFIIFFVLSAFFIITYLNQVIAEKNSSLNQVINEMKKVIKQKEILNKKVIILEKNVSLLEKTILEKENTLSEVNQKLEDIEKIIKYIPPKDVKTIKKRVNLAKMNIEDKKFVMANLPNGYPVDYSGITSPYGWRINPILKKREFHTGLDLKAKMNTPVYATADGLVEYSGFHKTSGYGKLIILTHNFGFKTLYGHLNKIVVRDAQFVKKGQLIAYSGNTGLSNGPHLHYEMRYLGMSINPLYFCRWDLKEYNLIFKQEKKIPWQSLIKAIQYQKKLVQQQLSVHNQD